MVSQVKVVSILMIVHGSMISLVGLLYAIMGPFVMAMVSMDKGGGKLKSEEQTILTVVFIFYFIAGLLGLVSGILHIVAGIRTLKFRGRTLALVALFFNIPGLAVLHCFPFSIGMAVYGLIVFFNKDVVRAFEMAAEGVPPEEILEEFAPRRRRRPRYEDDYDDRDDDRRRPPRDSWEGSGEDQNRPR